MAFGGMGGTFGGFMPRVQPESEVVQTAQEAARPFWDRFLGSGPRQQRENYYNWYYQQPSVAKGPDGRPTMAAQQAATKGILGQFAPSQPERDRLNAQAYAGFSNPSGASLQAPTVDTPDFAAIRQARAIENSYQQRETLGQQAYDAMSGWNQQNGMLGADYSNANFGQVSGLGNTKMNVPAGVNTSWMSSIFDPNRASTGIFGTNGQPQSRWGL